MVRIPYSIWLWTGLRLPTGKLVYFKVLGRSIIVLDSYDTACEILDKRSRNYSDRPDSVMANLYAIYRP